MSNFRILLSIISAIVLFLYGLGAFSAEIQRVGGETLTKWLGRLTQSRWLAVLLGAVATSIVQSSSAITALTVALVDAGTMSLRSSLGVLLEANIGTTSTACAGVTHVCGAYPLLRIRRAEESSWRGQIDAALFLPSRGISSYKTANSLISPMRGMRKESLQQNPAI